MSRKVVVQILRAPAGGIRKHVYDILTELPRDKYEHIFITNVKDADYPIPHLPNLKVYDLNIQDQPSARDLKNLILIYFYLLNKNVQIIHGHGAKGGLYARLIAFLLRAQAIYTPHGGSLHRVHGKIKNFVYDTIELSLIPLTDTLLFESFYSRDIFSKNILDVSNKSVVNYNGIETPHSKANSLYRAGEHLRMVSFGLLRHLKGHDIVIEACAVLKEKGIPFSYHIFGMGEELENLNRLIKKLGLEEQVKILNYSTNVPEDMIKYDLVVHPSRYESFGYVPVEAMALKVPVLTSQEGGLKEVVTKETGLFSPHNLSQEYADIVVQIFKGRVNLVDVTENAYKRFNSEFTRKRMVDRIEAIYAGRFPSFFL